MMPTNDVRASFARRSCMCPFLLCKMYSSLLHSLSRWWWCLLSCEKEMFILAFFPEYLEDTNVMSSIWEWLSLIVISFVCLISCQICFSAVLLQLTTLIVSDSSSDWLMSLREISSQSQELTVVHILSYPSLYPLTTMMMTKRTTPFVLYYLIFPSFVDMTDPETLRECHEVSWRQNTKMGSERMLAKDIFILQRCYERTERWSWWWWCWKRHED